MVTWILIGLGYVALILLFRHAGGMNAAGDAITDLARRWYGRTALRGTPSST